MSSASAKIIPLRTPKTRKRRAKRTVLERLLPKSKGGRAVGLEARTNKATGKIRWYWRAPYKAVAAGFQPSTVRVWGDTQETILKRCEQLADQAHRFLNPMPDAIGADKEIRFTGTIGSLIRLYMRLPHSSFHVLREASRQSRVSSLKILDRKHGSAKLDSLSKASLFEWHREFTKPRRPGGKPRIAAASAHMIALKALFKFGTGEYPDCERLSAAIGSMTFKKAARRGVVLTAKQAEAICKRANSDGVPSVALVQAIMSDTALRQKDVIGEFVPMRNALGNKTRRKLWQWGIVWEDHISKELILRKPTSKSNGAKAVLIDLRECPNVMAELKKIPLADRKGPLVKCETTGQPWKAWKFRKTWRALAEKVNIPKAIQSRDRRAGVVTEAVNAGVSLDFMRHLTGHADIKTAEIYDRDALSKTTQIRELINAAAKKGGKPK